MNLLIEIMSERYNQKLLHALRQTRPRSSKIQINPPLFSLILTQLPEILSYRRDLWDYVRHFA